MRAITASIVLAGLVVAAACGGGITADRHTNVILITLDTTRADHIDTGGGAKAFTPELRRWAGNSVVFEEAFCTIPQTLPSHLSMLTSRLPAENRVYSNDFKYENPLRMIQEKLKDEGFETAAVVSLGTLASDTGIARGFDTFIESLNEPSVFYTPADRITKEAIRQVDRLNRLNRRRFFLMVHYSDPHSPYAPPSVGGDFIIEADGKEAARFNAYRGAILRLTVPLGNGSHTIRFRNLGTPGDFTGFVLRHLKTGKKGNAVFQNIEYSKEHYSGAYVMRGNEGEIRIRGEKDNAFELFQVIPMLNLKAANNNYRKEVEYMDRYVGKFLRHLEAEGLTGRTAVVIVGDHGEGLGERDRFYGHVRYLNRQFIQVPFMMYLPGVPASRVTTPVSLTSITPTLLQYLGMDGTEFNPHLGLLAALTGGKEGQSRSLPVRDIYSFAFSPSAVKDKVSVIHWPYQFIYVADTAGGEGESELYDFAHSQSFRKWDQLSPEVLMRRSRDRFLASRKGLKTWTPGKRPGNLARTDKSPVDREKLEKLKTMGYVQ